MKTRDLLILAAFLTSTLTACGGGGGASSLLTPPVDTNGGIGTQTVQTEDAIASADAVGNPIQDFTNFNDSPSSPLQSSGSQTLGAATQKRIGNLQ